jgi:hypothetical protein
MEKGVKYILLGLIMVVLFLPLGQEYLNLSKIRPLRGDFVPAPNVRITQKTWFSKEFQDKKEKFLQDNFGYHNTYIRLHNQIGYYLFKKAKANGVIIGKKDYLYEQNYIDAYNGDDFIGMDSIRKKMMMVKFLADTFKKLNKTFLVVFEPGKGAFYPEYIPANKKTIKGITNIEVYAQLAKEMKIPYMDLHSWFIQNKTRSKYPLMPKYGIHWSMYGATLAWDSILHTIERDRNIDIPDMDWTTIRLEKGKDTDIDIEQGMNLLFRLKPEELAYPDIKFSTVVKPGQTKPSVLVIGDSFYWQAFAAGISNIFDRSDFWYYFREAHSPRFEKTKMMEEVDIMDEISKHDVILIAATDVHLPKFGWGFIETVFGIYKGTIPRISFDPEYSKKIDQTMENIRQDEVWMKKIKEKALFKKISVDSMLFLDAQWIVDEENKLQITNPK